MSALRTVGGILMRWCLAGVFIYAGIVKLLDPVSFVASIARFQIVPTSIVHPIALGLPPFEVLCGITILVGPWKRQAALSIALLSAIFLFAILAAVVRGFDVKCSCFGGTSAEPVWSLIIRDLLFFVSASQLYMRDFHRSAKPQAGNAPAGGVLNRAH